MPFSSGHCPNRVLPNLNTHCKYSTTAPFFDSIKYDYNHYETIPLYYQSYSQSNNVLSKDNISPIQGHHPNNELYPIYDVASFHPDSQSINEFSKHNISPFQGHHPNNELYPIYDVASFHPDSRSIYALSRDNISLSHNISPFQGHHPNNELYPIYDVASFHPDSRSIYALSRDNISLIEGHHPNRALGANEKNDGSGNMKPKPLTKPYFKMPPESKPLTKPYFKMLPEEKTYWEKKRDDLNIAIFFNVLAEG